MRIRRILLENIGPHEVLDWSWDPGVIGILGPNGSGKSTAVNAAYACLTNDFSRFANGKRGVLRQQAPDDAKASVRVEVEHLGQQYAITRGIRPDKHEFARIGDTDRPITKAGLVNAAIESQLEITRPLLDNYVFVAQWDMFAFLTLTEGERAKHFARLCGTTDAEACWTALGKQLELDRELAVSVVDTTDEIKQELAASGHRLKALGEELEQAAAKVLPRKTVDKLRNVGPARQRFVEASRKFPQAEQDEEEKLRIARKATSAVKTAEEDLRNAQVLLQEAQSDVEEHTTELAELRTKLQQQVDREELEAELLELNSHPPVSPTKPPLIRGLTEKQIANNLREANTNVNDAERLIDACGGDVPECPTCHTATDDPGLQERLQLTIETLPELLEFQAQAASISAAYADYVVQLGRYEQWEAEHAKDVRRITQQLKKLPVVDVEAVKDRAATLQEKRHHRDACRQAVQQAEEPLASLREAKQQAINRHVAAKQLKKQLSATMQTCKVSASEAKAASSRLARHDTAYESATGLKSQIAEIERSQRGGKKRLKAMQVALSQAAQGREWIAFLESARNVLHRDRLPAEVHRAVLHEMEHGINEDLLAFGAPFTIQSNESLGFTAFFHNGTVMPAEGLSGGEKVSLALPFRLQVNSMFAAQVGMLVLDEPTAGLDADHVDAVIEVFDQLRGMAKAQGFQIVVITHEKELERAFDQVFRVGCS